MKSSIIKRLEEIEKRQEMKKRPDLPDLIIISEEDDGFRIQETYCKHDAKGRIVIGSGRNKIIHVENRDDYKEPEGFKGVMIDGIIYE